MMKGAAEEHRSVGIGTGLSTITEAKENGSGASVRRL
jgi:hypothetical protein